VTRFVTPEGVHGRSVRVRIAALSLLGLGACQPAAAPNQAVAEGPALLSAVPSSLAQKPCAPTGPELCFNATDDNCNGIIDEGCGLHTGLVQFAIAWNEPRADVDLRLFDPSGELIEVGRTARSGLVKERDCPGRNNECHGQNLENVYLSDGEPLRGDYRVRIRLEALGGENPPIHVAFGARVGPKTYSETVSLDAPEAERELIFRL
jgi:tRNA (guanosine-2'-O-)-methyltransferase